MIDWKNLAFQDQRFGGYPSDRKQFLDIRHYIIAIHRNNKPLAIMIGRSIQILIADGEASIHPKCPGPDLDPFAQARFESRADSFRGSACRTISIS